MRCLLLTLVLVSRVFAGCVMSGSPTAINDSLQFSFGLGTPAPHKACHLLVHGPTEVRELAYAENVGDYSQKLSYVLPSEGDYVFTYEWRASASSAWIMQESWHVRVGSALNTSVLNADTSPIVMAGYEFWWGTSYDFTAYDARSVAYYSGVENYLLQTGGVDYSHSVNQIYALPARSTSLDGTTVTYTSQASQGYYSHEASVLGYHSSLLRHAGVNAVMADYSNVVNEAFAESYLESGSVAPRHAFFQAIRQNAAVQASLRAGVKATTSYSSNLFQLYSTWEQVSDAPKIIPLTGALSYDGTDTADVKSQSAFLVKGSDGLSPFQRQILYFLAMQERFPTMSVQYLGKPLLVIYHGVLAVDSFISATTDQLAELEQDSSLPFHPSQLTIRHMSGFIDSQTALWASDARTAHPPYVATKGNLWSWYDRIQCNFDSNDGFSSYALCPDGQTVEFSAACLSSLSHGSGERLYPFNSGEQLAYFLTKALKLRPRFLLVGQFNQFVNDGAGFTQQGSINFEPTQTWGQAIYDVVSTFTQRYLAQRDGSRAARVVDIRYRSLLGTGEHTPILGFTLAGAPQRVAAVGSNPTQVVGLSAAAYQLQLVDSTGHLNTTNAAWSLSDYGQTPDTTRTNLLRSSRSYANYLTYHPGAYDSTVNYLAADTPAIFADLFPGTYCLLGNTSGTGHAITHLSLEDWIGDSRLSSFSLRCYVDGTDGALMTITVLADTTVQLRRNLEPLQGQVSEILADAQVQALDANGNELARFSDTVAHSVTLRTGVNYLTVTSSSGKGVSLLQVGL